MIDARAKWGPEVGEYIDQLRNATVEECAREVQSKKQKPNEVVGAIWNDVLDAAAAAIRALKDRP